MLPFSRLLLATTTLLSLLTPGQSATPAQWRPRAIYQLMTDRFSRPDGSTTAPCAIGFDGFCGGTWQGIINNLSYIQGMGFDAIWISPITQQVNDGSRAYNGYSQTNLYGLNSNFGTAQDLKNLAAALHSRGMYLMVDVVTNHFAYEGDAYSTNYASMTPFNQQQYFHPVCWITDYTNQTEVELCWLGNEQYPLPDVDTTLSYVRTTYNSWIQGLISNYSIDGFRVDSVKNVEQPFWSQFQAAAGVYMVGEVADGDTAYVASYQNYMDGVLNYAMYYQLTGFFSTPSTTNANLLNQMAYLNDITKDFSLMAPFSENHDQPRFPSYTSDMSLAKQVIAFTLLADGIPIIYSGQEQHLSGGASPNDREAIWLTGYPTNSVLYTFIATVNKLRHLAISQNSGYVNYEALLIYNDDHNFVMRKGYDGYQIVAVYNNLGSTASSYALPVSNTYYTSGITVMEVLSCTQVVMGSNGILTVTLKSGLPLVYYPLTLLKGSGICGQ